MKIPILIVSDAITSSSGLGGRITRELSVRLNEHCSDIFDVATAGFQGVYSKKFPFPQYSFQRMGDWTIPELPAIWLDHAGDRKGIVMWIWNASWLPWVAMPDTVANEDLRAWLKSRLFQKWVYAPVDSECLNGKLSNDEKKIFLGFDRVLAYTKFGADLINKTIMPNGEPLVPYVPHGIDNEVFYPRDRREARKVFIDKVVRRGKGLIDDKVTLLSVVATNSPRKDWGLAFETCGELLKRGMNIGLWAHTDAFKKHWDLLSLADAFDMRNRTIFTNQHLSDEDMSWGYAACDVHLAIGSGEGWGSPATEALACGIPTVHGNYAGSLEYMPKHMLVDPVAFRWEGFYANKRPVFRADEWADKVQDIIQAPCDQRRSLIGQRFHWNNLWPVWEKWFREGIETTRLPLQRIKALNYDHHRRMTEDYHRIKAEEKLHPETANHRENLDDAAYRTMLAEVPKGGKILELGSASGGQWHVLKEWSEDLTGIDLFEPAVRESQKNGLNIHLGFVEEMPFDKESFSLICSRHVMEHVASVPAAMAEIRRVLKPGGYIAAATPHYFPDIEPAHINQLRCEEWVSEYVKAGFEVISAEVRKVVNPEAHIVARKPEVCT